MTKNSPKRFKGALNKKLKQTPHPSFLADEREWDKWTKERHALQMQTMDALLKWYSIDDQSKNKWFQLAFKLGQDFVPAMQFEEQRGAKKEWDVQNLFALSILAEQTLTKNPSSKKAIFSKLKKEAKGTRLEPLLKDLSPKSLENKCYAFEKTGEYELFKKLESKAKSENRLEAFWSIFLKPEETLPKNS